MLVPSHQSAFFFKWKYAKAKSKTPSEYWIFQYLWGNSACQNYLSICWTLISIVPHSPCNSPLKLQYIVPFRDCVIRCTGVDNYLLAHPFSLDHLLEDMAGRGYCHYPSLLDIALGSQLCLQMRDKLTCVSHMLSEDLYWKCYCLLLFLRSFGNFIDYIRFVL